MKNLYKRLLLTLLVIQSAVVFAQDFTDSNLPIVIINTDINPETNQPYEIPDDPRVLATMKIIKHPDGSRNYLTDQNTPAYLNYNGRISIEIRGSTSQWLPKKPYGLTTLQANNTSNNNVSLLGMPSENDWVLNSLAYDPSLIRDYLSYNLARQIGNYAPRTQYCEVVINGDYKGLYVFQEKIKADSNRVNVVKITTADNALPELSGGYITKSDKTTGGDPVAWSMSSYNGTTDFLHDLPKPEEVTTQQDAYIHSQFTNLGLTAHNNNTSFVNGYPSVIDVPTFVDFMVLSELSSNADSYQFSTYFHKDRNGKLRAGPIWDYNLTYGNDLFDFGLDRSHYDVWQLDNGDNTGAKFWRDLFVNPTFRCYLSKRWNELTAAGQPLKHNSLVTFIDQTVTYIGEAIPREAERWGTVPDHALEIDNLKTWLYQRINWMTANLGGFSACNAIVTPPLVINRINYNPGTSGSFPVSNDQEFIEIKNAGTQTVNLGGIYFKELGISYVFPAATVEAGQSVYLASNLATFEARYGFAAFGQFTRNLSNSKQKLVLADSFGNTIDTVEYFDASPWPNADGNGSYLQLIDTALDNNLASSWIASNASLSATAFAKTNRTVYPNPVSGNLNISAATDIESVQIFDISGKLLREFNCHSKETAVDFSDFAQGIYFVKISGEGYAQTEKIIRK
ncbi:CotH kinase family protein [Flavobacterium sp.]|uniref:CotH kinase family protein n=1 Tax=Flavobacterium sp. TaxID=239 RepID=UPI0039E32BB5